jgi:hypothetical protein
MIHFRLEHDATVLIQMLQQPNDLPNVPMMQCISFICLFDMEFHHVPRSLMKLEDTFSCGPHIGTSHLNESEDVEEFLDHWESGF